VAGSPLDNGRPNLGAIGRGANNGPGADDTSVNPRLLPPDGDAGEGAAPRAGGSFLDEGTGGVIPSAPQSILTEGI
jgi:hypothetical protein